MRPVKDYLPVAKEYEAVFRKVLTDLRDNREERPQGHLVPENLNADLPLEELFEMYSAGERAGIFTILNFERPQPDSAILSFEDVAFMSGGGAVLEYLVNKDDSVEYKGPVLIRRS
jgi:hypothetical protein